LPQKRRGINRRSGKRMDSVDVDGGLNVFRHPHTPKPAPPPPSRLSPDSCAPKNPDQPHIGMFAGNNQNLIFICVIPRKCLRWIYE
jgi:hypothetical protein